MKKRILFITNPKSGTQTAIQKQALNDLILQLATALFEVHVTPTQYARHATTLAQEATQQGFNYVVAIGGDGTINEVAQALVGTNTVLGIIPMGSGNGLARHLGIPMDSTLALKKIFEEKVMAIDACYLSNPTQAFIPFFCTAGVGFDATVAHRFAQQPSRGLQTYIKTTVQSFFGYRPQVYRLEIDGQVIEKQAFAITFANANQYGNDAFVAPDALIDDGLIDICILKPFPAWLAPSVGLRLFRKTLPQSPFVEVYRAKELRISQDSPLLIHFDGEPKQLEVSNLHITNKTKVLNVLV